MDLQRRQLVPDKASDYLLEVLRSDFALGAKVLVHENQNSRDETEEESKTEDDQVTDTLGKRRFTSEEGGLPGVSGKGRDNVVLFKHGGCLDDLKSMTVQQNVCRRSSVVVVVDSLVEKARNEKQKIQNCGG